MLRIERVAIGENLQDKLLNKFIKSKKVVLTMVLEKVKLVFEKRKEVYDT